MSAVHGVQEVDLAIHPPPDLVVEVDITNASKIKLPIYAAIGVPEVWRFDGRSIHVLIHQDGTLVASTYSHVLPGFPVDEAAKRLGQIDAIGETQLLRAFQQELCR